MNCERSLAAEQRLLTAIDRYTRRVAEAERMLRVEMDIYSGEMNRLRAADIGIGAVPLPSSSLADTRREGASWAK